MAEIRKLETTREELECASEILRMLSLTSENWVADVGAAAGYYAERISSLVPNGRVFAVEISAVALKILQERKTDSAIENLVVVEGSPDDPHLPENTLDAVVVVRTYHAMAQPRAMLEHLRRALKPGGRLVVVDWRNSRSRPTDPRQKQVEVDEIAMSIVEAELRAAGFEVLERLEPLCKRPPNVEPGRTTGEDLWAIIAHDPG